MTDCYCGSGKRYIDCCQPVHQQHQQAETAEQLMRARYSAYCIANDAFIISTHKADKVPTREELQTIFDNTHWLGLTIYQANSIDANHAQVEFCAWFKDKPSNKLDGLRERSDFVRHEGLWYYTSGQQRTPQPPGRNDSCVCNSGKKFKKCCGR
ncbi:YchJ family protein [Paraferrimonas haliotis]|uniref:UPF0225 protein n=1 Tax=Paraferrimonas haliotis TaxID=2013866 RepID=A0AA37WYG3_9GAMM|nr:YchJ family protein [Paraferrimonas haliotis]GLS84439.1 UPF0225 protein [Paraferrimonas haliotis]